MRRALAAVLALAALGASVLPFASEARDRRCMRSSRAGRTFDCAGYAFFEAFPASGAGTTSACSTTAPTGAKGEALTFTRGSTAYCTKTASGGLATTGIANGDLVSMSNNVARVEYDSAGVLGLRVEGARTNSLLRSQETNVSPWASGGAGGASAPVFVGGTETAPDGTATADRWQFGACAGNTAQSVVYQQTALTAAATHSVYVKSVGGAASISVCGYTAGSGNPCVTCNANSSTWTRCSVYWNNATATQWIILGCNNLQTTYTGQSNTGAADVLLWQAQAEAGAYATSPILTTTAAQTRGAETASFAVSTDPSVGSIAATGTTPWSVASSSAAIGATPIATGTGAVYGILPVINNNASTVSVYAAGATPNPFTTASAWAANGSRIWVSAQPGGATANVNGVTATSSTQPTSGSRTAISIGMDTNSQRQIDGVVSRVCYDPDSGRCR